jgi:hypothetical protein
MGAPFGSIAHPHRVMVMLTGMLPGVVVTVKRNTLLQSPSLRVPWGERHAETVYLKVVSWRH